MHRRFALGFHAGRQAPYVTLRVFSQYSPSLCLKDYTKTYADIDITSSLSMKECISCMLLHAQDDTHKLQGQALSCIAVCVCLALCHCCPAPATYTQLMSCLYLASVWSSGRTIANNTALSGF